MKTPTLRIGPGSRPKTDDAIAMFVEDWKGLWKLAKSGTLQAVSYCNIHGVWQSAKEIKVEA